jgi:hypothetical protein
VQNVASFELYDSCVSGKEVGGVEEAKSTTSTVGGVVVLSRGKNTYVVED